MLERRVASIALLIATFATSRSEVQLTSTPATRAVPERADAPTAIIRTVKDERTFEQAPKQPSTPSLGSIPAFGPSQSTLTLRPT